MKHTKGPWYLRKVSKYDIVNGENFIVACDNVALPDDECQANAHLIAAAPEMLEALEELTEVVRRFGGIPLNDPFKYDKLIKKAKGE